MFNGSNPIPIPNSSGNPILPTLTPSSDLSTIVKIPGHLTPSPTLSSSSSHSLSNTLPLSEFNISRGTGRDESSTPLGHNNLKFYCPGSPNPLAPFAPQTPQLLSLGSSNAIPASSSSGDVTSISLPNKSRLGKIIFAVSCLWQEDNFVVSTSPNSGRFYPLGHSGDGLMRKVDAVIGEIPAHNVEQFCFMNTAYANRHYYQLNERFLSPSASVTDFEKRAKIKGLEMEFKWLQDNIEAFRKLKTHFGNKMDLFCWSESQFSLQCIFDGGIDSEKDTNVTDKHIILWKSNGEWYLKLAGISSFAKIEASASHNQDSIDELTKKFIETRLKTSLLRDDKPVVLPSDAILNDIAVHIYHSSACVNSLEFKCIEWVRFIEFLYKSAPSYAGDEARCNEYIFQRYNSIFPTSQLVPSGIKDFSKKFFKIVNQTISLFIHNPEIICSMVHKNVSENDQRLAARDFLFEESALFYVLGVTKDYNYQIYPGLANLVEVMFWELMGSKMKPVAIGADSDIIKWMEIQKPKELKKMPKQQKYLQYSTATSSLPPFRSTTTIGGTTNSSVVPSRLSSSAPLPVPFVFTTRYGRVETADAGRMAELIIALEKKDELLQGGGGFFSQPGGKLSHRSNSLPIPSSSAESGAESIIERAFSR